MIFRIDRKFTQIVESRLDRDRRSSNWILMKDHMIWNVQILQLSYCTLWIVYINEETVEISFYLKGNRLVSEGNVDSQTTKGELKHEPPDVTADRMLIIDSR